MPNTPQVLAVSKNRKCQLLLKYEGAQLLVALLSGEIHRVHNQIEVLLMLAEALELLITLLLHKIKLEFELMLDFTFFYSRSLALF